MIPTIEDIIAKLLSGEMGKGEAERLIYMHMEKREQREYYAALALQALNTDGAYSAQCAGEWAKDAYIVADAMIEAGK